MNPSSPPAGSPTPSPANPPSPSSPQEHQFKDAITRELFGKKMTIVTWNRQQYLIGVQIAHYLKRETFNLYRSMKLANIDIVKCQPSEIEELTQLDAIKRGIHSVTLVPYDQGIAYISKELRRKPRKKCEKRARKDPDIVLSNFASQASPSSAPSADNVMHSNDEFGNDSVENDDSPDGSSGSDESASSSPSSRPTTTTDSSSTASSADTQLKRLRWQRLLQFALAEHSRLETLSA